jgi:hypothetical protein
MKYHLKAIRFSFLQEIKDKKEKDDRYMVA